MNPTEAERSGDGDALSLMSLPLAAILGVAGVFAMGLSWAACDENIQAGTKRATACGYAGTPHGLLWWLYALAPAGLFLVLSRLVSTRTRLIVALSASALCYGLLLRAATS